MSKLEVTGTSINKKASFDQHSLPAAISSLLEMNNYAVTHDIHVNGAQIDLVAKSKGDPFAPVLYIEATIEYVSTAKYGKDATKFLLVQNKDPGCRCLCVSSVGFTAEVVERAQLSRVQTLTYDELFRMFEKFSEYVEAVAKDNATAQLISSYEEPQFNDKRGQQFATKWLNQWKEYAPDEAKWLIVLGEYGTGKTSLTKVLQARWLAEYHEDPSKPLPIRIELRNFSRQFDARGLLHHFLDSNRLSHISIDFVLHLIRTGRAVLLLDGYDEMAQYLNARERRACLKALADLSSDGAKGIITSRPNYFTETEELNVFEALYSTLEQNRYYISQADKSFIDEEKAVDQLVERYVLERYERNLQDLTPAQTEALVRRKLNKDTKGQDIILSILRRVFREEEGGRRQALSGKPVIISYLLELVDELRKETTSQAIEEYSEWLLYKMIIDRLMLRDAGRTSLPAHLRRKSLQALALLLSRRGTAVGDQSVFEKIIDEEFRVELRRLSPEERRLKREELFEELRSSATLTRVGGGGKDGYLFSHNSLREYLVCEAFLESLAAHDPIVVRVPISAAMRSFTTSMGDASSKTIIQSLSDLWPQRANGMALGPYLILVWDLLKRQFGDSEAALKKVTGLGSSTAHLSNISVRDWDLSDMNGRSLILNGSASDFSEVSFTGINLRGSNFGSCVLDGVDFSKCDLRDVDFSASLIFETSFINANVDGADFRGVDLDIDIVTKSASGSERILGGKDAVGWLKFNGAITDPIDDIHVLSNHKHYPIVLKIAEKLTNNAKNQLLGLTQRGVADADPRFARDVLNAIVAAGWASINKNDLVTVTGAGRTELLKMIEGRQMPDRIANILRTSA